MVLVSRYTPAHRDFWQAPAGLQPSDPVGDKATHGKGTVQQVIDLGTQLQGDEVPSWAH